MRVHNALIVITLIAIILVSTLIFTMKITEPFTELYFENHHNLPKEVELNKSYFFNFIVHNMENKKLDYTYQIYVNSKTLLKNGEFTLDHNQSITFQTSFIIKESFERAKIIVRLENKDQEIYFWVKQK